MQSTKSDFTGLLDEFALKGKGQWASDWQFKVACLLGVAISLLLFSGQGSIKAEQSWQTLAVVVVVSPLLEELLFRGILQGRLLKSRWGSLHFFGFTSANLCCSLLFTALHFTSHEPLWALGVLFPSLLFGYFRDRHNSVYPSMALHVLYNAMYFVLPIGLTASL